MKIKHFVLSKLALSWSLIFLSSCVSDSSKVEIYMQEIGGVYQIPCKVNGVSMNFIFDTGASNVCISLTEALYLYKNGHITNSDFGSTSYSQIADGSIVENMKLNLHLVEVGGIVINDVEAIVVSSLNAPLLLGQTAIQRLGNIELNGNHLTIYPYSEISTNSNIYNKKGLLWKIQDWWNDGWHYICDIEPVYKTSSWCRYREHDTHKLYCYKDAEQGTATYQVWWKKGHSSKKMNIELNPNFGVKDKNYNKYKYRDCDYDFYFNMPIENYDVEWSKRQAELKAIEAKNWKFARTIDLYYITNGEHNTLSKEYGNLYWRDLDGQFMVVPCGTDVYNNFYDSKTCRMKMHEPKSPRMLMVEKELNDKFYEEHILWDNQHHYINSWMPYVKTFTHKAGEYSFDM